MPKNGELFVSTNVGFIAELRHIMSRITHIREQETVTVGARRCRRVKKVRYCVTVSLMTPTTRAVMCERAFTHGSARVHADAETETEAEQTADYTLGTSNHM